MKFLRCRSRKEKHATVSIEGDCDGCEASNPGETGRSVGELLLPQFALATGGLARDHRPLITFPDHSNFHFLTAPEYRRLLLYLTSVPSLLEADMGFHIIIDRRKDRWNSVKTALLRISEFFPGVIHAVYVLRPASFLQKALSEVSSKLFKEEFRFRVLVCSSVDELYEYFDRSQLTPDLGGDLQYSHAEWIQQRIALEKFSTLMKDISSKLDDFMHEIVDCDMGNDPTQTKELLDCQENRYKALKAELLSATTEGEELLTQVRKPNFIYNIISHVAAVERLLVQLEETEKQFDNFWQKHSTKLNHWLKFRTFLLNFKQMQATLDGHLKKACDMTEVGETASRVENLIQEANDFEKLCNCDLDTASAVIEDGEKLMEDPLSSIDHIESKCEELRRTSALLIDKIQKRNLLLTKAKELMDRIDKANEWCATGVELLAGEGGLLAVEKLLEEAKSFDLTSPDQFRDMLMQSATQETRALVAQVVQRVEDVWLMVSVKRTTLQKAAAKPARPVQSVPPQSAAPPPTPVPNNHMETSGGSESSGGEDAEARRARRGHVLTELLHTERIYVQELGSILKAAGTNIAADMLVGACHDRVPERPQAKSLSTHTLGRALQLVASCTMRHGKYDIRKSTNSVGTSYSWYYRKNEYPTTKKKKKRLKRTASDSTLFSDYTNQIIMFDKEKRANRKCKKSASCASKNQRIKCSVKMFKPVRMEPFVGNFYYGEPLPGFECTGKTEEKITYLPDSDAVSPSEETFTTLDSTTTAPTVVDLPEMVKNPLFGCSEEDLQLTAAKYFTDTASKDSQLNTSTCTEIKETMLSSQGTDDVCSSILKDFKRNMKEWNNTIVEHYSSLSQSKKSTSICPANTPSDVRSLNSSQSCRKSNRCTKSYTNMNYDYAYIRKIFDDKMRENTSRLPCGRKSQTLDRNHTFNASTVTGLSSTLRNLKEKAKFWKDYSDKVSPSECDCLETIYKDYDRRLQKWCETLSGCSSLTNTGYKEEIEKAENQNVIPAALVGQSDVLFGNLHELFTFHQDVFLKDLERCISATELVALCFVEKRETFFRLYSYYCQNIPRSERLRETLVDTHLFLQACQLRLGHKLPLAAYLLKPVQRITKYQLLLKDLLRYSECGSVSEGLQEALDCMLVVLKCVNDSMHQIAITGFPGDLCQQGELLIQGSFLVVSDSKRDLRLRLRARRRHIFLYEKTMLFCKPAAKNSHNKATYHYKHDLQMSQIGLTESVKGDARKFEVWRQGRSEVHTITAPTIEVKRAWVARIKRVLLDQLEELKGERVRQYSAQHHRALTQASSWELTPTTGSQQRTHPPPASTARTASCDTHIEEPCWSSDPSDDEEEEPEHTPAVGSALVARADYMAVGATEVSLREGQNAELIKVGCAGWWLVRLAGEHREGWAPAAYLDHRKTSRSSSRSHDRLHDH